MQQQIAALSNGIDVWQERDNPNERLLKMARTVMNDREQSRIKLPPPTSSSHDNMTGVSDNLKRNHG